MTKLIELKGISKSFDGERVLDSINLYIRDGEFVTLLGPSGCGKTTLLRIIGGFETADEGSLYFDGAEISEVPAYKRHINTVFQKYALFPHLNVYENIAFPLRLKKVKDENMKRPKKIPEEEIKRRVAEMLEMVKLSGFENKSVSTLSGGQQQRVAIARALLLTARERADTLGRSTAKSCYCQSFDFSSQGAFARRAARRPRPEAPQGYAKRA